MNIERVAINILKCGIRLDKKKCYTEALTCYQEGLQILVDKMKEEVDDDVKTCLRKKIEEYMNKAEDIKKIIFKQNDCGKFHEQINIKDNSTGHSYKTIFGRFLDSDVEYVIVHDPYIRTFHQVQNFLRLCELLVKSCKNLKHIDLVTCPDNISKKDRSRWFSALQNNLMKFNIQLIVKYSETLHDRQIMLSTGWIIKIGRGLDYFKPPENQFHIGAFDMDFRQCYETTVDIVHSKNVKQSYA